MTTPGNATMRLDCRTWLASEPVLGDAWPARVAAAIEIDPAATALMVVDLWEAHPAPVAARDLERFMPAISAVLAAFRAAGRPVLHDHSGLPVHPAVLAGWGSHDVDLQDPPIRRDPAALDAWLRAAGVTTLFWMGAHANMCVMANACGFRAMRAQDPSRTQVILRDACPSFEAADTAAARTLLDAAVYEVEYFGYSARALDVIAALSRARTAG